MMLQKNSPEDYVVATGETHSIREFLEVAFKSQGLRYQDYVKIDPELIRPAEVDLLIGDPSYARNSLGWVHETSFEGLVHEMVEEDIKLLQQPNLPVSA